MTTVHDLLASPPEAADRLLRTDEVAAILAVSRRLVQRLAATGDLPRVRLGRATRFRLRDVHRLMQDGVDPANEPAGRRVDQ